MDVSLFGLLTAIGAGAISFLSPCVLPLVPGYLSFIAGSEEQNVGARARVHTLVHATSFVAGFTTIFVLLGLGSQAIGGWLMHYRYEANLIGGALVMLFGLSMTGALRLHWLLGDYRWRGPSLIRSPATAYTLGVAFAFGWTPCIGPVLASILVVTSTSAAAGAILLGAYGLGLGIPFLLTALLSGTAAGHLRHLRALGRGLHFAAGVVLIGMGALMITGRLQLLAIYLLDAFPALARLG